MRQQRAHRYPSSLIPAHCHSPCRRTTAMRTALDWSRFRVLRPMRFHMRTPALHFVEHSGRVEGAEENRESQRINELHTAIASMWGGCDERKRACVHACISPSVCNDADRDRERARSIDRNEGLFVDHASCRDGQCARMHGVSVSVNTHTHTHIGRESMMLSVCMWTVNGMMGNGNWGACEAPL